MLSLIRALQGQTTSPSTSTHGCGLEILKKLHALLECHATGSALISEYWRGNSDDKDSIERQIIYASAPFTIFSVIDAQERLMDYLK